MVNPMLQMQQMQMMQMQQMQQCLDLQKVTRHACCMVGACCIAEDGWHGDDDGQHASWLEIQRVQGDPTHL